MAGAGGTECSTALLKLLSQKADIELVFKSDKQLKGSEQEEKASTRKRKSTSLTDGTSTEEDGTAASSNDTLQVNSCLLGFHSGVLGPIMELALSQSSGSNDSLKQIPVNGSTKADFLAVLEFVYPVTPLPKVTWNNLEVLLVESNKWDMQVPLAHALEFFQAHATELDVSPASPRFLFKWLQIADQAGLADVIKTCLQKIVATNAGAQLCTRSMLKSLSHDTMIQLVEGLVKGHSGFCYRCGMSSFCTRKICCELCNHPI